MDYDRDVASTIEAYRDEKGIVYEIDGKIVVDYMKTYLQKSEYSNVHILTESASVDEYDSMSRDELIAENKRLKSINSGLMATQPIVKSSI